MMKRRIFAGITLAHGALDRAGGLVPDVPFQPSMADVLSEADTGLAFALDVIRRKLRGP